MVKRLSCQIKSLQQGTPLADAQSCAADASKIVSLLSDANDELLNVERGIAKHLICAWIGIIRAVEKVRRLRWRSRRLRGRRWCPECPDRRSLFARPGSVAAP